jgi:hypothetical protein
MTAEIETAACGGTDPVQGPAAPTQADLLWASGMAREAIANLPMSSPQRALALDNEGAAYTAAHHLGAEAEYDFEAEL